ncbi:MAG: PIG-L family deacetylase [Dehalococcoidia bacterium]|nr:PIG-L family deacetylase [Dehalococcoidia bacterium]
MSLRHIYRDFLVRRCLRRGTAFDEAALRRPAFILAPHPDDETFGCGGTIARKLAAGATIHVIVMTDGSRVPASAAPADLVEVRRAETLEAARELGLDATYCHFLDSPDGALAAHLGNAVEQLVALFEEWPAEQLFLPYRADGHPDHIATAEAGFRAARLAGRRFEVYEYPVWAWRHWPWVGLRLPYGHEFSPWRTSMRFAFGLCFTSSFTTVSDVRAVASAKSAAALAHGSQMREGVPAGGWSMRIVSRGDLLETLLGPIEVFKRSTVGDDA